MKKPFALAAILTLAALTLAQTGTEPPRSPKEVVREFVKLELEGARLTVEGRRSLPHFVVHPGTEVPDPINIVSDKFNVDELHSPKTHPKLNVYFPYFYGWLDSALRFTASIHMEPGNGLIREGTNAEYSLTDKDGNLQSSGPPASSASRVQEWRIDDTHSYGFVSLTTAIRYVTEKRDKATDPTIMKNADEALAKLKKLVRGP